MACVFFVLGRLCLGVVCGGDGDHAPRASTESDFHLCGADFDRAAFDEGIADDVVAFGSTAKDGDKVAAGIAGVKVVAVGFLFCAPCVPNFVGAEDDGHSLLEGVVDIGEGFDGIACDGKVDTLGTIGGQSIFDSCKAHGVGGGGVVAVHGIAHGVDGAVSGFRGGLLGEAEGVECHEGGGWAAIAVSVGDIATSCGIVVGGGSPLSQKRLIGLLCGGGEGFVDGRGRRGKAWALDQALFEGLCGGLVVNARDGEVMCALEASDTAFGARAKVSRAAVHIGLGEIARVDEALLECADIFAMGATFKGSSRSDGGGGGRFGWWGGGCLAHGLCGGLVVNARSGEVIGALVTAYSGFGAGSKDAGAGVHIGLGEVACLDKVVLEVADIAALSAALERWSGELWCGRAV